MYKDVIVNEKKRKAALKTIKEKQESFKKDEIIKTSLRFLTANNSTSMVGVLTDYNGETLSIKGCNGMMKMPKSKFSSGVIAYAERWAKKSEIIRRPSE